jgi:hypothetical protein
MTERNLLALESRNPELARLVRQADPNPDITFAASRAGDLVPCARAPGRARALHSLADPVREGERMAGSIAGAGFVVALGLGGGFHLRPLLERSDLACLLVIEKDPGTLKVLLGGPDMRPLLGDPRVVVAASTDASTIQAMVLSAYLPALAGDLRTLPLRPWCEREKAYFEKAADGVRRAAEAVKADVGAQAHFGKRWFSNILLNLAPAQEASRLAPSREQAIVTAAGPSLEGQLPEIARRRQGSTLIATDTSLPALRASGIEPDLVLSIDCQIYGYNHFLSCPARERPTLLLDLASPPLLARLTPRRAFFASSHPLCEYLGRHWMALPTIDTSGGNVAHAAVSLADRLGARSVRLYGADFSCPRGKSYARGTYLYDVLGRKSCRCAPISTSFFSFLYRSGDTRREKTGDSFRYTTPLLLRYKENLEALSRRIAARVLAAEGEGLSLDLDRAPAEPHGSIQAGWAAGPARCGWQAALREYAQGLDRVPRARPPFAAWFAGLDPGDRELWMTLLPLVPAIRREQREEQAGAGEQILERAREWALARLSRVLSEHDPRVADE